MRLIVIIILAFFNSSIPALSERIATQEAEKVIAEGRVIYVTPRNKYDESNEMPSTYFGYNGSLYFCYVITGKTTVFPDCIDTKSKTD
jgi:hypothetical protein